MRRISPKMQFPLHQRFCRPSMHWFLCDLEWARCKGSWNALEKDGTHLYLQLHTQICLQKKRENDDCLWEKLNSCTFQVDFNFLRWLSEHPPLWLWLWESRKKARTRYKIEKADSGLLQLSEHQQQQYMVLLHHKEKLFWIQKNTWVQSIYSRLFSRYNIYSIWHSDVWAAAAIYGSPPQSELAKVIRGFNNYLCSKGFQPKNFFLS